MSPSSPVLVVKNASRVHESPAGQVQALQDFSLQIMPGELVAVMGPSGSGKSTLLHLAGGLDLPTAGDVVVEGKNLGHLSPKELAKVRRQTIGYVFQDFNLIPALTALENVSMPLELDGLGPRAARKQAQQALVEVGIAELANRFADELSGGQAQRVAIARAIVGPRRLILADEPTGALDSVTGEEVMRVLRERIDAGAAGLLVTHDARFAAWADRTIFLRDGHYVDGTRAENPSQLLVGTE